MDWPTSISGPNTFIKNSIQILFLLLVLDAQHCIQPWSLLSELKSFFQPLMPFIPIYRTSLVASVPKSLNSLIIPEWDIYGIYTNITYIHIYLLKKNKLKEKAKRKTLLTGFNTVPCVNRTDHKRKAGLPVPADSNSSHQWVSNMHHVPQHKAVWAKEAKCCSPAQKEQPHVNNKVSLPSKWSS